MKWRSEANYFILMGQIMAAAASVKITPLKQGKPSNDTNIEGEA
jgi:hypothetical protein